MTREKEIEEQIKQQMLVIQQKMERLEAWKSSGYSEPCQEHVWVHTFIGGAIEMFQEGNSDPLTYIVRFKCHRCGMTMEQQAVVGQETLFDEWLEYREIEGDEEE